MPVFSYPSLGKRGEKTVLDVAIVDDEKDVRDELDQMVRRFAGQEGVRIETRPYADGSELLVAAREGRASHDVILLDIEMSEVDGMDAAHELRRLGCDAQIVFVTNMAQYAIRGYEVGAFDFVVKPVEYPVFAFKFRRVVEAVAARRRDRVVLETKDGFVRLDACRGFAAGNACYLVNLERVDGLSGEYVRVGGEQLKMSRGRQREFVDALTRSMGR